MNRTLPVCILAALLAGCAVPQRPPTAPAQLNEQRARITDSAINADYKTYELQQARIKALNDSGQHAVKSYSLAKAQCWLDVSFHEYSRNDRGAFVQAALSESYKITEYLQGGGAPGAAENPANQTPLANNAAKLREDLWDEAQNLKRHEGFKCAEQLVACGEVELAHAGNELNQQGWRHAKPYVQLAEDKLGEARAAAASCVKPAPPAPAAAPAAPPPPPPPPPAATVVEKITLNASALFKFDKRGTADLLAQGKAELDQLAQRINSVYASVESIQLTGHTDRLGSSAYNQKLSEDRANTVKAYLQGQGVTAPISTQGRGEAEPVAQCPGGNTPTKALTDCLQPNRRVEILITGTKR